MDLISQIVERAKANKQRIVLPEGTEERTLKAANQILTDGVADLILLGNPDEIMSLAKQWGLGNIGKATIIDPTDHPKKEEYAQLLCELRKKKGMTIEEARKLVVDPLYLGCLIIKAGDADGQLAGARNTTGNVLRPALQIIKTTPGITCVSGAMLLLTHAPEYGNNGVIVMGLQFEVMKYRLEKEYNVTVNVEPISYTCARWTEGDVPPEELIGLDNAMVVYDRRERPVYLLPNAWQAGWLEERNKDVVFLQSPPLGVARLEGN